MLASIINELRVINGARGRSALTRSAPAEQTKHLGHATFDNP